eukprot:COSAG04_NODE_16984_length_483_cov_0.807292_1_plen_93_part_01
MRRALLLLLCSVDDRAQARRRGRRFCAAHPLPAELEGIIDIARAVERTACDYLGSDTPPRRLSLGRWTEAAEAALGERARSVEAAMSRESDIL